MAIEWCEIEGDGKRRAYIYRHYVERSIQFAFDVLTVSQLLPVQWAVKREARIIG